MAHTSIKLETSGQEESITILQPSIIHQTSPQTIGVTQPHAAFGIASQHQSPTSLNLTNANGVRPQSVTYQNIQQLPFLQTSSGGQIIQNANGMFQVVQPVEENLIENLLYSKNTFNCRCKLSKQ